MQYSRVLWWIKKDIRLEDNIAVNQALLDGKEVLPVFVFEKDTLTAADTSLFHILAQCQALKDIQSKLAKYKTKIWIAEGNITQIFEQIYSVFPYEAIYSHQETGNSITFKRDKKIKSWSKSKKIHWYEFFQNGVIRGLSDRDKRYNFWQARMNTNIFVFTHNKPWYQTNILSQIAHFDWQKFRSRYSFSYVDSAYVSETVAQEVLQDFLTRRGKYYRGGISSMNKAVYASSRLAPHLTWGTITNKQVIQKTSYFIKNSGVDTYHKKSLASFLQRVSWRDHFIQKFESQCTIEHQCMNVAFEQVNYSGTQSELDAWISGYTGCPLIDAAMRCLQETGWLNFRMRACIVSFACFSLGLDWKMIRDPLARLFADYEIGIHVPQLQMQYGVTGINTIRVYSVKKQIIDHDPECVFIKRWVPELQDYSVEEILQYDSKRLTPYTNPILNFSVRKKVMKDQMYSIKKSQAAKVFSKDVVRKHASRKNRKKTSLKKSKNKNQLALF